MENEFTFRATVQKFPGIGGWVYVSVPKKYSSQLKEQRSFWGMYPIEVQVGKTSWETKLMLKKGGDFFVALKKAVRDKEHIQVGHSIRISFELL